MSALKFTLGRFDNMDSLEVAGADGLSGDGYKPIRGVIPYTADDAMDVSLDDFMRILKDAIEVTIWTERENTPADPTETPIERRYRVHRPVTLADLFPEPLGI